jgi:hypothetical protein
MDLMIWLIAGVLMPLVVIKGFEMYKVWKGKRKIWR